MLIKNIKNISCGILLAICCCFFTFNALANDKAQPNQEQLIDQIEHFFTQNQETLHHERINALTYNIINNREKFPSDTIAKTYFLLANLATNKGELEAAFQFTQDGLAIHHIKKKTQLCLQIKLAEIYSAQRRYPKLLKITDTALKSKDAKINIKYFLFALSYRSVAHAMLNNHHDALKDLQQIEEIIEQKPDFTEHISLLTILASAYYHLDDYQTAISVQLKILTLRFNLNRLGNISQTYYHLANAYYRLNRYNDAYNAYWEAKNYSEKNKALIFTAYAQQGLGLTLIKQKKYTAAKAELLQANTIFFQHKLTTFQVETLISLSRINKLLGIDNSALLMSIETLLNGQLLTKDYIIIYQLLANHYHNSNNLDQAFYWQKKYSLALRKLNQIMPVYIDAIQKVKTRNLALKLAQQSDLTTSYANKYYTQQLAIIILASIVMISLVMLLFWWLKRRAINLKSVYDELEMPRYVMNNSRKTRELYKSTFNMARKYTYPLSIGYIEITNWQELTLKFDKKIVKEVNKGITNLINDKLNEFESAGLINNGEYLLFFPHQNKAESALTMHTLITALKARFFANLGDFSVIISYSVESPNIQDIDPYVFLSQLSSSAKIV